MKQHLIWVHSQYKRFKEAGLEVERDSDVVTMQVDWSENKKLTQSGEEKTAYYYEDRISLHPARVWTKEGSFSYCAMGDSTDHKAPAVMASLRDILKWFAESGTKKIIMISDSPTNQYRNKGMFWLCKQFCEEFGIEMVWIYLEVGHGKGVPDGIGATVKKAIQDLMLRNPDVPMYTVDDLLESGLREAVPSVGIHTYDQESLEQFYDAVLKLNPIIGTMKIHEMVYKLSNGVVQMHSKDKSSDTHSEQCVLTLKAEKKKRPSKKPANEYVSESNSEEEEPAKKIIKQRKCILSKRA